MSYQIGIDTIHLRPTPRLAHTEYCSDWPLIRAVAGDDGTDPKRNQEFLDAWQIDFIWSAYPGPRHYRHGRNTDMGHAEFLEGGIDLREPQPSPFTTPEEVLAFDAVEEYGLHPFDELVEDLENHYQTQQRARPNQVYPGGYYTTIVSGAIQAFGWDMLLEAAADRDGFAKVLDSFFRHSLHHYQAWAETSCEAFISHDDFVWSQGAFMHPDIYRQVIIPRYAQLWKVLKDRGKRVLFCSDANWIEFLDDLVEAGADGFIFEPMVPLDPIVEKYGQTHVIVGSKVDCRTMALGTKDQVRQQIDDTLAIAKACPGFMFAVGNHIPSNVPIEMGMFYFEYLSENWHR